MSSMKKILVPLAVMKQSPDTIAPIHFARATYIEKIVKYNLTPVFVSHMMSKTMIDGLYRECSGALFMGGGDFDPAHYGLVKHKETSVTEPARDELEIYLLKKILQDKMPFLGICRGMQALVIASGGTLHQHIPDIVKEEKHNVKSYDELVQLQHSVFIDKQSRLFEIVQKDQVMVNSGHHQSPNDVGKDLIVSGRSPGGIIESVEHKDRDYFCIGVQSHPEVVTDSFFEKVFECFSSICALKKTFKPNDF